MDAADAETVVVNGITAWQMLHRTARVRSGATIVVLGANGGVGSTLVQLARHAGITVIGTASPRHHPALREMGGTPVDYRDPDMYRRILEIAPAAWTRGRLPAPGTDAAGRRRPQPSGGRAVPALRGRIGAGTGRVTDRRREGRHRPRRLTAATVTHRVRPRHRPKPTLRDVMTTVTLPSPAAPASTHGIDIDSRAMNSCWI